jgi:hypothetical protein
MVFVLKNNLINFLMKLYVSMNIHFLYIIIFLDSVVRRATRVSYIEINYITQYWTKANYK